MKRVLSLLLALSLCLSLTGCITVKIEDSKEEETGKSTKATKTTKVTKATEETESAEQELTEATKATKPSATAVTTPSVTAATTPSVTETTKPADTESENKNYTVSDAKLEKQKNVVIAKAGDQTLTNEQLQVYYWLTVRNYIANYSYYLSTVGLDLTKPLNEQIYDEKTDQTWQQYFLEMALDEWHRYVSLYQLAEDDGYTLPKEYQNQLDTLDESLTAMALEAGFADAEALIDAELSKGSSISAYYYYMQIQYMALGYVDSIYTELNPTDKELEDYYTAHKTELESNGYGKDAGKYYDVRHIFITLGENGGDYSDADWAACLADAQKMLDDFLANDPTEEKFAELAKVHSEDPGSAANGGLYSRLTKNYGFIQEFEDWYVDESRQPGDTGIVKNTGSSSVGYHIMYFSGATEIWKDEVESLVISEKMQKIVDAAEEAYPMKVYDDKIALGEADLTAD